MFLDMKKREILRSRGNKIDGFLGGQSLNVLLLILPTCNLKLEKNCEEIICFMTAGNLIMCEVKVHTVVSLGS